MEENMQTKAMGGRVRLVPSFRETGTFHPEPVAIVDYSFLQ